MICRVGVIKSISLLLRQYTLKKNQHYIIRDKRNPPHNRPTLGNGLAGLQCSPPTNSKLGKYGRGNSKSQYVLISQISAFPIISHNVVGLPGEN